MSPMPAEDRETLERLLGETGAGDAQAFRTLYRLTSARLFGVCLRMLRDRSEAEEVLQETYATVWRRAASFDPTLAAPQTWLVTLARNKAIDRLRQRREATLDDATVLEGVVDERPGPSAEAEAQDGYRRLHDCLDALDPKHANSVREAFFSGATYMELAAGLRVPLGTMKSWIRRALIQLRSCLETG